MSVTKDGTKLVYQDRNSARIYVIYTKNEYLTKRHQAHAQWAER